MICRRVRYFTDSEMIDYYQKSAAEIASLRKKLRRIICKLKDIKNGKFVDFVNCCTLVVLSTEGYQIIYYFSRVNRLISCNFIMPRMYIWKTSWEQDKQKSGSQRSWGSLGLRWAPQQGFFWEETPKKLLSSKRHIYWLKIGLNSTEMITIKGYKRTI